MSLRLQYYSIYLLPVVMVAIVIITLEIAGIDPLVTAWFYDAHSGTFPWRYNDFLEVVMHHWVKYLVVLVAATAFTGYLVSFLAPQTKPLRPSFLFVALALTLAPLAVAALRYISIRHCPWDFDAFGGSLPYVGSIGSYPDGVAPGRCSPASHASTGFCLFAFHFLGRSLGNAVLERTGFALGLAAGLGLGFVRIAQGAHFLSHVLWSGVVCWIVIVVLHDFSYVSQDEIQGL